MATPNARWTNDARQGSAFHELLVLPTLAPNLARPYYTVLGLRTVRNTGTAVINTVQTGKNQTETGQSSLWAIPNGSGRV